MKPMKMMEREFSVPMLAGTIVPMMNEAMDLGFSFPMMILVASVACYYATLRVVHKIAEIKYAQKKVELVPAKVPAPPPLPAQ